MLGSFFSPARGLFLYFPAALLALILVVRRVSALSSNALFLALSTGIVLITNPWTVFPALASLLKTNPKVKAF
jgi:hypothetical protein